MKESLRILDIQALLDDYIDFDFIDQLSAPKRKRDQHYYTTYLGILRDEYAVMAPDMTALVIKEIMKEQAENYKKNQCDLESIPRDSLRRPSRRQFLYYPE